MPNYKSIFTLFAHNTTNTIPAAIVPQLLRQAGHIFTERDSKRIVMNIHQETLTYDEFLSVAEEARIYEIGHDKVRAAFLAFDAEKTGFVNTALVRSMLMEEDSRVDESEIDEIMRILCKESDEKFNYESFLKKCFSGN
ncbi:hypothetical protein COBT_001556 [Conglomerata obtusa]